MPLKQRIFRHEQMWTNHSNLPVKEFFTVQSVSTSACSFKGQAAEVFQVNTILQDPLSSYKNCGWESFKKNLVCSVDSQLHSVLLHKKDGSSVKKRFHPNWIILLRKWVLMHYNSPINSRNICKSGSWYGQITFPQSLFKLYFRKRTTEFLSQVNIISVFHSTFPSSVQSFPWL